MRVGGDSRAGVRRPPVTEVIGARSFRDEGDDDRDEGGNSERRERRRWSEG